MAEQIGTITILHGTAQAEGPDGVRILEADSPVYNSETISTGVKAAVEITFTDGATLSQGPNSQVQLDDYVFDPDSDAGEITIGLLEGTFRSVTGQIVDMNPEGFTIETPTATIGIRGTTTGHAIAKGGMEAHTVLDFVDKPVLFQGVGGALRIISEDGMSVGSTPTGLSPAFRAPASQLAVFRQLSPEALQRGLPRFDLEAAKDAAEKAEQDAKDAKDAADEAADKADEAADKAAEAQAAAEAAAAEAEAAAQAAAEAEGAEAAALQQAAAEAAAAQAAAEAAAVQAAAEAEAAEAAAQQAAANAAAAQAAAEAAAVQATVQEAAGRPNPMIDGPGGDETGGGEGGDLEGGTGRDDLGGMVGQPVEQPGPPLPTLSGGPLSPPQIGLLIPDDEEDIPIIDDIPVPEVNTTLNLSAETDAMVVDLSGEPAYFEVSGDSSSTETLASSVVNVIGSLTNSNVITGDNRANILTGGQVNDTINGGAGDDTVYALGDTSMSARGDKYDGGAGTGDLLSYEGLSIGVAKTSETAVMYEIGGTHTDTISGFEHFTGSNHNDILYGSSGNNEIKGLDGNDFLWSGGGEDSLYGGDGDDTLKVEGTAIGGLLDGGSGSDKITVYSNADLSALDSVTGIEKITYESGNKSLTVEAQDFAGFNTGAGSYELDGSGGDQTLTVNADATTPSDETINLSGMSFTTWDPADKININGNSGNDTLTGSSQGDTISGDAGNDVIRGLAGDDSLAGGTGNDLLFGGAGVDTIKGGTGTDTISYIEVTAAGISADLDGNVTTDGDGGSDTIMGFEVFEGTNKADDITTSDNTAVAHTIYGRGGDDQFSYMGNSTVKTIIDGGSGDDIISLNADVFSGSTIDGCVGSDSVKAYSTIDATGLTSISNVEIVEIAGTADTLSLSSTVASGKSWTVNVASGDNIVSLVGGVGVDDVDLSGMTFNISGNGRVEFLGGAGNDILRMGTKMSSKIKYDGGAGTGDKLYYTNSAGATSLNLVTNVEEIILGDAATVVATVETLVASGEVLKVDASNLTGSNALNWDGSAEGDGRFDFEGSANADTLIGGNGADTFEGGAGADDMSSIGAGNVFVFSAGDVAAGERIYVNDGAGALLVQGSNNFGLATIEGINELRIEGGGSTASFTSDQLEVNTFTVFGNTSDSALANNLRSMETLEISVGNGDGFMGADHTFDGSWDDTKDVVAIQCAAGNEDVTATSVADVITGLAGDDTLRGGFGNDTIDGGDDADKLFGNEGADVITGGSGNDTLIGGENGDTLSGGIGSDIFQYNAANEGDDVINGYSSAEDQFHFTDNAFSGLGPGVLSDTNFEVVTNSQYLVDGQTGVTDADNHYIYYNDGSTFALYYDADGSGGSASTLIATFDGDVGLDHTDITLI